MSDDTPTGRDLDVGLARLMGFDYAQTSDEMSDEPLSRVVGPDGPLTDSRWWVSREFAHRAIPEYHRSLDALFAPGGPVEYARNKGLEIGIDMEIEKGVAFISVSDGRRGTWNQHGSQTLRLSQADGTLTLEGIAVALATALYEAFMKDSEHVLRP